MTIRSLFDDNNAKVPFAVIGVFLLLVSVIASINLVRMDVNMAKAISSRGEVQAADTALLYAKADLARAINYAGMDALKQLGETPLIKPDNGSAYYTDSPDETNRNWAKAMIRHTLNQYIESNYRYDTYAFQGYSVNVEPIDSWEAMVIQPIRMKLNRSLVPPVMLPGENGYETYWKVSVPLKIHLTDLAGKTELTSSNITIETLITARYPLLKDLTDEYSMRLNGSNAVMVETTALSMAYTWARGYMQYYRGAPANIVNNTHLSLMLNGALLLDQGFVFNSVDPMSILEYSKQTAFVLTGKSMDYRNVTLDNGSLKIDPQQDAFNSTGDPTGAEEDYNRARQFDLNATPITDYLNNGSVDSFAAQKIREVLPQVYSTGLATGVARQISQTEGQHDGYETSHSVEGWGEPDSMNLMGTMPREDNVPGVLYGEIWDVTWTRLHVWRHYYIVYYECTKTKTVPCSDSEGNPSTCTIEYTTTCSRTEYYEMTATDTRVDRVTITLKAQENSNTNIQMKYRGGTLSSRNDVVKPYETRDVNYSTVHLDAQLEEAYVRYKSEVFDANKVSNLKNQGLAGDIDARTYSSNSPSPDNIASPFWLPTEAQDAVDEITDAISNDVHLDPDINYTSFPVPSDLLVAARDDLIMKIARNESRYVDKERYFNGVLYDSTSSKLISLVREWYVDEVKYQIYEKFTGGSDIINSEIRKNFSEPDKVMQANRDGAKLLSSGMYLPLGLTMRAYHTDEEGNVYPDEVLEAWNESVTLGVDQEPDYLYTMNNDVELRTLGVRSLNIFGTTGLPVLPSMNPWLIQTNAWKIEVQGKINKFQVFDGDNETHPNPIFGHEAQVYVREERKVFDSTNNNLPIGDNLPIKFSFTTGTFIAVPPGKYIGDDFAYVLEETNFDEKFKVNT